MWQNAWERDLLRARWSDGGRAERLSGDGTWHPAVTGCDSGVGPRRCLPARNSDARPREGAAQGNYLLHTASTPPHIFLATIRYWLCS